MIKNRSELNTVFDVRIAELEQKARSLETELEELGQGRVKTMLPGGNAYAIDLGKIPENELAQFLASHNPLVTRLVESQKKKQELRRELGLEVAKAFREKGLLARHARANRWLKSKNRLAGLIISSPWLLVAGLLILAIWAGPLLLYNLSNGEIGGVTPPKTKTPVGRLWTEIPAGTEKLNLYSLTRDDGGTGNSSGGAGPAGETADVIDRYDEPGFATPTPIITNIPETPGPVATHNPSRAPARTGRVGKNPDASGGFNGPHGAFLAPARLAVPALKLDALVQRALTEEDYASGVLNLRWPEGKEVTHFGAFPGELGNMLILGTQEGLGILRNLQQNDLINLYDRDGNLFRYRVLPFSPTGQTERIIDLASSTDGWIWKNTAEATLTILLTLPPESSGDRSDSFGVTGPGLSTNPALAVSDDYLTTRRLAYRAVLAIYSPATATPVGIPVAVPDAVWQTSPAIPSIPSKSPDNPTLNATTGTAGTPVPAPAYPGLPDTGDGFCYLNGCHNPPSKGGPRPE